MTFALYMDISQTAKEKKTYSVVVRHKDIESLGFTTAGHRHFTLEGAKEFCQKIAAGEIDPEAILAEFAAEDDAKERAVFREITEKTPFGYMVRGGETVPCPAEANAVQDIFTRYLAGASFSRIAEKMSRGNIPYHRHTNQWNKHMVKRILANGKYLGTGIYPRLISDEEFLAAQI